MPGIYIEIIKSVSENVEPKMLSRTGVSKELAQGSAALKLASAKDDYLKRRTI